MLRFPGPEHEFPLQFTRTAGGCASGTVFRASAGIASIALAASAAATGDQAGQQRKDGEQKE